MCGIAGIVTTHPQGPVIRSFLLRALHRLRHRGPDDAGVLLSDGLSITTGGDDPTCQIELPWIPTMPLTHCQLQEATIGLAHARLSIYDTSPAGHQPMCSPAGDLWVVFNGAIYNFKALREELRTYGHNFFTGTDTEVLLAGWRQWGESLLDKLEGMFAFVLYDMRSQILFGARDRTGVKPLYYTHQNGAFAFGSEQKALAGNHPIPFEWRDEAMAEWYFLRQLDSRPEGFFKHIQALLPGHTFTLHLPTMALSVQRWHHPQVAGWQNTGSNMRRCIESIRQTLSKAIELRAQADVPVATCLSGGLDSSVVTSLLQQSFGEPVTAFTATFPGFAQDESHWARQLSEHIGANWMPHTPTAEGFWADVEDLVYTQETPLQSISTYAQYSLMRHIRTSGFKVVLDGQGGDELFAGYPIHQVAVAREALVRGNVRFAIKVLQPYGIGFFARQWMKTEGMQWLPLPLRRGIARSASPHLSYLSRELQQVAWQRISDLGKESLSLNTLLATQYYDGYLSYLLKFEDRNSMRFGIESRVPLADTPALSDLLMQTPGSWKMHNGIPKYLLREAARPWLPTAITNRTDKLGFVTPNNQWLQQTAESWWSIVVASDRWLDNKAIGADKEKLMRGLQGPENYKLFPLLTAAILEQTFTRRLAAEDANAQL